MKKKEGRIKAFQNKKGLEMAFSTIVAIVLAVTLLIILLAFLTGGFKTFKEKISAHTMSSNVDLIIDNCNNLAEQNAAYEYCCVRKTVKTSDSEKFELSCIESSNRTWGSGKIDELNCEDIC